MTKEERDQKLRQMVTAYQTELLRLCYGCLRDKSMAEDAVQETFIKVYRKLDTLQPELNEKAWVYKIAINCSRDINRNSWYRRIVRDQELGTVADDKQSLPDQTIELTRAISLLKPKQREVILLHYYQGFTVDEIADILGLSQSSVSGRLRRAREHLSRILKDQGIDEGGAAHEVGTGQPYYPGCHQSGI